MQSDKCIFTCDLYNQNNKREKTRQFMNFKFKENTMGTAELLT